MDQHPLLRKFVMTRDEYTGRDVFGRLLRLERDNTLAIIKIAKTNQLYFVDIVDVKKATHADEMWSKLKETVAR